MVILWIYLAYTFSVALKIKYKTIEISLLYGLVKKNYDSSDLIVIEEKNGRYSNAIILKFRDGFKLVLISYSEDFADVRDYFFKNLNQ